MLDITTARCCSEADRGVTLKLRQRAFDISTQGAFGKVESQPSLNLRRILSHIQINQADRKSFWRGPYPKRVFINFWFEPRIYCFNFNNTHCCGTLKHRLDTSIPIIRSNQVVPTCLPMRNDSGRQNHQAPNDERVPVF